VLSSDDGRDLAEATFAMLRAAGFSAQETSDIARTAVQTASMLVTQEAGAELDVPAAERDQVIAAKRAAIAALPPERYPYIQECMDCLTATDDTEAYYRFGIDLYVGGVRELHESLAAQSRA
jgi:TetR/AcrR family tetracycline transcriptional repressor